MNTRSLLIVMVCAASMVACPSLEGFTGSDASPSDAVTCGDAGFALDVDPNNCGTCGHACLGGDCVSGRCKPAVLVSGLKNAVSLSVSDTYMSVMVDGGSNGTSHVFLCDREKCSKTFLEVHSLFGPALGVSLTASHLFWAYAEGGFTGRAMGCALPGCKAPAIYAPSGSERFAVADLRTGSVDAFWIRNEPGGGIQRCDPAGKLTQYSAKTTGLTQLYVHDVAGTETVYYANVVGEIHFSTAGGLGDFLLRPAGALGMFVVHGSQLIWSTGTEPDALQSCPVAGCQGAPTGVATALPTRVSSLATDGVHLYMSDRSGRILSCDPTRCNESMQILAEGQLAPIAVAKRSAPEAVYWLNTGTGGSGGSIMRVAE